MNLVFLTFIDYFHFSSVISNSYEKIKFLKEKKFKLCVFLFRGRLESNADQWLHLVNTLQELIGWVLEKQQELLAQRPLGGDTEALQRQNMDNQVCLLSSPLCRVCLNVKYEKCEIYIISVIEKKLYVSGKTMSTLIRLDRKGNCKLKILVQDYLWE